MRSLTALLLKWPLVRQIRERRDGTGLESMSDKTRAMQPPPGAPCARAGGGHGLEGKIDNR
jgi:hypothetical protein